jgi:uncharacterized OB-fold protein
METPAKPVPKIDPWVQPFWDGTRDNRLMIQQCTKCDQHIFYPRIACPFCAADEPRWVEAGGRGRIYSYTVVENNAPSAFIADMPYVIAVIELDEGVRMLSNVIGCEASELDCELPVEVVFEKLNEEITLPKFRLAGKQEEQ